MNVSLSEMSGVVYRATGELVEVLTVVHAARQFPVEKMRHSDQLARPLL